MDRSRDRQPYINTVRREVFSQDSPDQDHSDDPDVEESGASTRSRYRDGEDGVPRGPMNQAQQRQVSYFDCPDSAPVSESSCAKWCAVSGCPRGTWCRFHHGFPEGGQEARRIYSIVIHKQLTPRPELIELCEVSDRQPADDAPASSNTTVEHAQPSQPQKRQRLQGGMRERTRRR